MFNIMNDCFHLVFNYEGNICILFSDAGCNILKILLPPALTELSNVPLTKIHSFIIN